MNVKHKIGFVTRLQKNNPTTNEVTSTTTVVQRSYVHYSSSDGTTTHSQPLTPPNGAGDATTKSTSIPAPVLAWVEPSKEGSKQVEPTIRSEKVQHWLECSRKKNVPLASVDLVSLDAALVEEAIDTLQEGSTLWKVKSFSSWYRRRYVFDKDNKRIVYEGSRKFPCVSATEIIEIRDIHDIRKGWKTDRFNKIAFKVARAKQKRPEKPALMDELCCFSVIHGPEHQTLDLVCPDENVCNSWVRGLSHLIALQRSIEREQAFNNWLMDQFRKADLDKSGALNFDECMNLLRQLNIEMNKQHAKTVFEEANTNKVKRDGEDVIDEKEFVAFYKQLKKRPEIEELFDRYSVGTHVWSANHLLSFLEKEQKMTALTLEDADGIIDVYEPTQAKLDGFMSIEGFKKMLFSHPMDILNVSHRTVYQDMKQSLAHYYIASSHNTYAIADQIAGESSVEGYIRALKMGCRCVELDLWDGPDGEPIVYHGFTLMTKIRLRDILLDAIKPYAFATSEYPVILSLENHLSVEQQNVMVQQFKTILGDLLYTEPAPPSIVALPSPFKLKKKIIVKAKKLSESLSEPSNETEEVSGSDEEGESHDTSGSTKKLELSKELSDLVNICTAVHFRDFENSEEKGKVCEMSSVAEGKALKMAHVQTDEFIRHTQKQLMRIYPAGRRQGSSNYDPIPFWNVGCQIVSLNYQTRGQAMMVNDALFRTNGGCGYSLKPEFLRKGNTNMMSRARDISFRKILTIRIISGQCIPKPHQATTGEIIDPYVCVSILGYPDDQKLVKTKYVHNNGFNPIWNEMFVFEINVPELAFLHFLVRDYSAIGKDEKLGEYCLPFTSVQQGYRHIHLRDEFNRPMIPASIFVHVTVESPSTIETNHT